MYTIFAELLRKNNVTVADVSRATGINQSTFSNWKARNNLLSGKNAKLVADYFHVSVDYLMTGNSENSHLETSETKIDAFEKLMNSMGWIVDDANSTYEKVIIEKSGLKLETDLDTIEDIAEKTAQFVNNALLEVIQKKLSSDFIYPESNVKSSDSKVS